MDNKKKQGMKLIQCILGVMMIGSFLFLILGEAFFAPENALEENNFGIFEAEWVEVMPDGTTVPITVPGSCEVPHGEWGKVMTTLPADLENTWICARSMQQDMRFYVGDELRKEYSTLDTQPFGKTSTLTYVFFELEKEDAGKTLTLEFMSDSSYSGYISEMYTGGLYDITAHFCKMYLPSAIVAVLMLLVGLFVVFGSLFIQVFYKKEIDLMHLGTCMVICATWLLVESKIRQFIFPNSTVAMLMGFLMIALLPYPFIFYIDSVQKHRYQKIYMGIGIATAVNFAGVVLMQVFNIKDFYESMTSSHIVIVILIITMGTTIIRDVIKGYAREYREVAIGFAVLMAAGICEIGLVYVVSAQINGISLCVGLVILLVASGLKMIRDTLNIEKEKQSALAASESKAKFLANMSHEIRTPMNTVIGMSEMILRENTDENIDQYANSIKRAGQMLLGLINDILDFSKIEAGKLVIVEKDYKPLELVQDIVFGNEPRIIQKNLEMRTVVSKNIPAVLKGDDIRIKQILNNLVSNAIKYTEKGSITLSVDGKNDENGFSVIISVEDTGMGIKPEDLEKVFASFQRLELDKNRYIEGTGLGLSITKQLVELMNGTISVQSTYGKGSCFTVQLPQGVVDNTIVEVSEEKEEAISEKTKPQEEELLIPDAKILVVDDNNMNLTLIRALLKRTQAQLDTVTSGNDCLQKTKEKEYDLILMDHMMPQPDGIETLHMIREDAKNKNLTTPVVVLTANALEGMKEQYLSEGVADYLSKPVEVDKLDKMLIKFLK